MAKKRDLPAMPFYWGDWFKALDVQMLPRDVRCTWFEMLGRMWEGKKRGEISIDGKPPTDEELARLLGFGNDVEELQRHIEILERFSIFSRKKSGVIYNRKMVHSEDISRKRSICGSLGGKQKFSKDTSKNLANTEYEYEDEYVTKKLFKKPSIQELNIYISDNKLNIQAEEFIDYYDSNGWKVGKNAMKDWKATARRWSKKAPQATKTGDIQTKKTLDYIKALKEGKL